MTLNKIFGSLVCIISFGGCATTGDPNQGGLFGWSQSKADHRIASYRAEFNDENRRLESEQDTARRLNRQERSLQGRIRDVNAELSLMLSDVEQIGASGEPSLSRKTEALRSRIDDIKGQSSPEESQLRALRRDVELLREEHRLLQER